MKKRRLLPPIEVSHLTALKRVVIASLVWTLLGCGTAQEQVPDRLTGPVYDGADLLAPVDEKVLHTKLREYHRTTGNTVIVATVDSLHGEAIEHFARRIYGEWGIGDAKTNRGLLLLIAPNERRARIEVGCALETVVSNAQAQDVMDNEIITEMAAGRPSRGIQAGVDGLIEILETAEVAPGPVSAYCVELMGEAA